MPIRIETTIWKLAREQEQEFRLDLECTLGGPSRGAGTGDKSGDAAQQAVCRDCVLQTVQRGAVDPSRAAAEQSVEAVVRASSLI